MNSFFHLIRRPSTTLFPKKNDCAETFHATHSFRTLTPHPEFFSFVDVVHCLISETSMKLQAHRRNPKIRLGRVLSVHNFKTSLGDNFLKGPPLALALEELLFVLFEKLHAKTASRELFECSEDDGSDSSEVPMELVDRLFLCCPVLFKRGE